MEKESFVSKINRKLISPKNFDFTVLDLFAGCGGLSLGFEAVGFKSIGIEMDKDCCDTYNANLKGNCMKEFLTTKSKFPQADVVIGGPPCQPFSVRGKQNGINDPRNGFPIFIEAIKQIKPEIWLFENVKGILYKNKEYFDSVVEQLKNLGYLVKIEVLNASNFGVPQNRERIVVVGSKRDFEFPEKLLEKVTVGEALQNIQQEAIHPSKFLTPQMDLYIAKYEAASKCVTPRDLHFDRPARTLTCRNLAGSTSDMHRIKLSDGKRRRLSIREAARLQSFPDWFEFVGAEGSVFNQIGNAVPPLLAFQIANKIKEYFEKNPPSKKMIEVKYLNFSKQIKLGEIIA